MSLLTIGQQRSGAQPDRTSQQVDKSRLTPTTLEVSRGTHILEVVHVNDINNGGYNSSPVLSRDKGRREYLLSPQQSKSHHPDRPYHEIPPLQNGQGWRHERNSWRLDASTKGPGCALKPWVDFSVAELSSATLPATLSWAALG